MRCGAAVLTLLLLPGCVEESTNRPAAPAAEHIPALKEIVTSYAGTPRFSADPNPVPVCAGPNRVELRWDVPEELAPLEVRIGTPDGPLLLRHDAPVGSATTGDLIESDLAVYLLSRSQPWFARITVEATRTDCA